MTLSIASNLNEAPIRTCPSCAKVGLVSCETSTEIWREGRPYLIANIPALRCASCNAVLVERDTAQDLKAIAREIPFARRSTRGLETPTISFRASSVSDRRYYAT